MVVVLARQTLNGQSEDLRVIGSRPGSFLRQETLLHIVSLPPRCINGYRRHTAGGNPAMD